MQKIILQGNIGKEVKQVTFGDRTQLSFSLACTNRDREKSTTWYNVLSDNLRIESYLNPGKPIIVTGDLSIKLSQGKDGKSYVNINVNNADIDFLPSPKQNGEPTKPQRVEQSAPQKNSTLFEGDNNGLPF